MLRDILLLALKHNRWTLEVVIKAIATAIRAQVSLETLIITDKHQLVHPKWASSRKERICRQHTLCSRSSLWLKVRYRNWDRGSNLRHHFSIKTQEEVSGINQASMEVNMTKPNQMSVSSLLGIWWWIHNNIQCSGRLLLAPNSHHTNSNGAHRSQYNKVWLTWPKPSIVNFHSIRTNAKIVATTIEKFLQPQNHPWSSLEPEQSSCLLKNLTKSGLDSKTFSSSQKRRSWRTVWKN